MKKQKQSKLFQALLCSSAAATVATPVFAQDGVSRVGETGFGADPNLNFDQIAMQDGVSQVAQVPNYATLPEFMPSQGDNGATGNLGLPQRTWQDELGPRYRFETRIGEWLGNEDNGEASINVMLPFAPGGQTDTIVLLDTRGTVTYQGGGATTVGVGLRSYNPIRNRITGIAAHFDYDGGNRRDYHQIGVSFESLGKWVDFRANGYFVTSENTHVLNTSFSDPGLGGTGIQVNQNQFMESAYSGVSAELGGPLPLIGRYGFETYVGGYHYATDDDNQASGVSVRVEAQITDDVKLGINVTKDDIFDTQVFGSIIINLPDGRRQTWFRPKSVRSKLLSRYERRNRVFAHERTKTTRIQSTNLAFNPVPNGVPNAPAFNRIIFVDPEAASNGDGTFESPLNTLVNFTSPNDSVMYLVNDGTLEGSATLFDNSLAVSVDLMNQGPFIVQTAAGLFDIPSWDANAGSTTWQNSTGGTLITLAGDNTQVGGFTFDGTTTAGQANDIIVGANIAGVQIHTNTFQDYRNGVTLNNVTGTVAAANPTMVYSNNFYGQTAGGTSRNGFTLTNAGPDTLDLEIGSTPFNIRATQSRARGNVAIGNSGEDLNGDGTLNAGEDFTANNMLDEGNAFVISAQNQAVINAQVFGNSTTTEDLNNDGILDTEDTNANGLLDTGEDTNGNGVLDFGEDLNRNNGLDIGNGNGFVFNSQATASTINLAFVDNVIDANIGEGVQLNAQFSTINAGTIGEDVNGNGVLDGFEDLNRNGILDLSEDTNRNGILDFGEDTNFDGNLDVFEDLNGDGLLTLNEDLNLNGTLDPGEDINGNGTLDAFEDTNRNGILDPGEDTNGNGVLDLVEDFDSDGRLDLVEDFDGDGLLDFGEDGNEPDSNNNGIFEASEDLNGDGFRNTGNGDGLLDGGQVFHANVFTRNGSDAIQINSTGGSNVLINMTGNTIGNPTLLTDGNGGAGLAINADSGLIDANIGFVFHEDLNFNSVIDPNEDMNVNSRLDVAGITDSSVNEDLNFNNILDIGEDVNGNGYLDRPRTEGNSFISNSGGINVNLTGTAMGTIDVINNRISGTGGGRLGFTVDEDLAATPVMLTQPFNLINLSDIGVNITNVNWDIGASGLQVDAAASPFTVINGSDVVTGLISSNGDTVSPFSIPDLATSVDLVFNSFNPINGIFDINEDVNNNGVLDVGEDLNLNGQLDAGIGEDFNGNGVLDPGEDINLNGILDPGEDLNNNGIFDNEDINLNGVLDPGEDANNNGILDLNEDMPDTFSYNLGLALAGQPGSMVTVNDLAGSPVDVTFSNGQIVNGSLELNPTNLTQLIFVATTSNQGTSNGINLDVRDSATLQGVIGNNTITGFGGSGLNVQAMGSGNVSNLRIGGNTISGNGQNGGNGVTFRTSNGPSSQITASLLNNMITNNFGLGVSAIADGGSITLTQLENNIINANAGGIELLATQGGSLTARITNNSVSNSQNGTGMDAHGIAVTADNSTVLLEEIAFNNIANNEGDGLQLNAINGGMLSVTPNEDVNSNDVLDLGEDVNEDLDNDGQLDPGEDVNMDTFLNQGNGNGFLDHGIFNNVFTNNLQNNVVFNAVNGTISLSSASQNTVSSTTAGSGNVVFNITSGTVSGRFTANTISSDPVANVASGPGILVNATGGTFDLQFGGPGAGDGNQISRVNGAGIGVQMTADATGAFVIQNNNIMDIFDDNDLTTPFNGDGVTVDLSGPGSTATLTRSEITGNNIGDQNSTNAGLDGSGVFITLNDSTSIQDLLVSTNTIGNIGRLERVEVIPANDDDAGIKFVRFGNSTTDVVAPRTGQIRAVTIDGNVVTNNPGDIVALTVTDGLRLEGNDSINDVQDFTISNNTFSDNSGNGIQTITRGDATMNTDIQNNTIENNLLSGILLTGIELVSTDLESQGGTWIGNTIRNNTLDGITINAVMGDVDPLIIGQNGVDPFTGQSFGNIIDDNLVNGITITGGGFIQINNNSIANNGAIGVDIDVTNVGTHATLLQNNVITDNASDGIEFLSDGTMTSYLIAFGNTISDNLGRGVDILNRQDSTANIRFGDGTIANRNMITGNAFEGFYVVNTASPTQDQTSPATTALLADGLVSVSPDMVLDVNNNIIQANNNAGTFSGGGLVLRVGSNNSAAVFTGSDPSGALGVPNGVGSNSGGLLDGNGRVNARIVDNTFGAHLGDDVLIEGFVSTADPIATAGTWNALVFAVTAIESDPLARLNLSFNGNVGDSLDVNRLGASYNNAEATFKSKLITNAPGGPFTDAARERNAQRIPARAPDFAAPLFSPDFGAFQYPGVGESTFRLESDFSLAGFRQTGAMFAIDGSPVPPSFNANGVPFATGLIGELPFGWGTVSPGTFGYDAPFIGVFNLP
jgi:hypothetical protein